MEKLIDVFNQIKEHFQKNINNVSLTELHNLISKEDKTEFDRGKLIQILTIIEELLRCIRSLGQNHFDFNANSIVKKSTQFILYDNIEMKTNGLVMVFNIYLETLKKLISILDSKTDRFALLKLYSYLVSAKEFLIKKSTEYNKLVMKNESNRSMIHTVLNDVVDVYLRESSSLNLIDIYKDLSNLLTKN